jgi:enoyl-CoA hydratase
VIERETHGEVALVRLAHGKASALDLELCQSLERELERVAASGARALVLTGTGAIFSAGVDLVRVVEGGARYLERFLPAFERAARRLFELELPVVCALNGHAIAGGCVFACAADRRLLAAGRARLAVPELLVGVPFPAIALEIVRRVWPPPLLDGAAFTGRAWSAEEALAHGLVDELVEPAELAERALAAARALGAIPPRSFALTKRMLRRPAQLLLERHEREVGPEMLAAWCDPAVLAAVGAYVERTLGK